MFDSVILEIFESFLPVTAYRLEIGIPKARTTVQGQAGRLSIKQEA